MVFECYPNRPTTQLKTQEEDVRAQVPNRFTPRVYLIISTSDIRCNLGLPPREYRVTEPVI